MARLDVQYIQYSTEGSVARQFLPTFPKKQTTAVTRMHKYVRTHIYVDPVAILGIVVAVCMFIMMAVGVFQLQNAQAEAARMEHYVLQLSAENKALENQYVTGYDLEEIEQTARALGMVSAEEVPAFSVTVEEPQVEEEPTFWEGIGTFLTGLFA